MKNYIFSFLILFLIKTGYSQETIYLLFDIENPDFSQTFNKEIVGEYEEYINYKYSFKIRKKLKKKYKNLEEEIKYSFNWGTRRLSFVHNKYNDSIVINNKWLKEKFIVDFEYLSGYKWVTSKNVDELSMDSLYLLMNEKILQLHSESPYRRLTSLIPKIYELDNLYYKKYKFYKHHIVKNSLNKKRIDVIDFKKYKCYDKFVKLRERLLKANKIYIVKKENDETHLYEVALLKIIGVQ